MASKTKQTVNKTTTTNKESASPLRKDTPRDFTFNLIPEKFQTPVFIAIIILLIIVFFKSGLFDGKVFSSADNIASDSWKTFLDDAKKEGIFPLWVPY